MKNTKVERARRNAAMLRRQFLHGDGGLFDQVLDDQTLATEFAAHGKPGRDRGDTSGVNRPRLMPTSTSHPVLRASDLLVWLYKIPT